VPPPFRRSSVAIPAARPSTPHLLFGPTLLVRSLARALGGEKPAERFLRDVLDETGLVRVPDGREAFVEFVRDQLLPRLMPYVRLGDLHELVRRTIGEEEGVQPPPLSEGRTLGAGSLGASSVPAKERPRVAVVVPDAMRRLSLARALVRDRFDVEAFSRPKDVLAADPFHALVLVLDEEGEGVVRALAERKIRAGLVLLDDESTDRDAHRRAIDAWTNDRVAIVARDAQPSALCARVRIVVES
jgi:hypothetical protein